MMEQNEGGNTKKSWAAFEKAIDGRYIKIHRERTKYGEIYIAERFHTLPSQKLGYEVIWAARNMVQRNEYEATTSRKFRITDTIKVARFHLERREQVFREYH